MSKEEKGDMKERVMPRVTVRGGGGGGLGRKETLHVALIILRAV